MLDQEAAGEGHRHHGLAVVDGSRLELFLGLAHHRHLRVGVDHRRYCVVTHAIGPSEHRVDRDYPFADRHVREHVPPGHVAAGPDVGHVGAALGVHSDAPSRHVDARLLQPEVGDDGSAAGGVEDVRRRIAVLGAGDILIVQRVGLDAQDQAGQVDLNAAAAQDLEQLVGDVTVAAGGDPRQRFVHRDFGADLMEEGGELETDVATADDRDPLRHCRELERRGRVENTLPVDAGDRRDCGSRARRDEDVGCLVPLPIDLDRVATHQAAGSVEHLHARVTQQRRYAAFQRADDSVLARNQRRHVEAGRADDYAENSRLAILAEKSGGAEECLRRDAPDVQAGATQLGFLDDGHTLAEIARMGSGLVPTRPGADDN